ncbi:MAG: tripartite tricarboxylate transporter substrate-binding protein, partial [Betaproteobacteria bacterium]|nr:tripartite tricarboxylate transporter substrate-binding protein [Betaproteobacteria bacterium]
PPEVIAKLQIEVNKAMQTATIRDVWAQQGASPGGNSPAEFGAFVKAEIAKWAKVAKESGARVD